VVSSTPRPHFTPGKDPVPILQGAGWAAGLVWTGGKSRPHRDSILDRPARGQSLYRLSYRPTNPFTALKTYHHFASLHFFFSLILSALHFTLHCCSYLQLNSLNLTSLHFLSPSLPRTGFHFPNPRFENMRFIEGSPHRPFR